MLQSRVNLITARYELAAGGRANGLHISVRHVHAFCPQAIQCRSLHKFLYLSFAQVVATPVIDNCNILNVSSTWCLGYAAMGQHE